MAESEFLWVRVPALSRLTLLFQEILRAPFPKWDQPASRVGPPSPLDLCHEGVSGRCRTKSWGTITYGQNLDLKELRSGQPRSAFQKWDWMRCCCTVSASTMMAQLSCGPQGQMSHGAVEKGFPKSRDPSTAQALHYVSHLLRSGWQNLGQVTPTETTGPGLWRGRVCSWFAKS